MHTEQGEQRRGEHVEPLLDAGDATARLIDMGDRLIRQPVLQLVDERHEIGGSLAVQPGQPPCRHRGAEKIGQSPPPRAMGTWSRTSR